MKLDYAHLIQWGSKIAIALAILLVGYWLTRWSVSIVKKGLTRKGVDASLISFAGNIISVTLMLVIIIAALSKLGINTTSLVAVIGAAGLAIGLALQGSLSNFASGVLIATLRPFKSGDFVEAGGCAGSVVEIQLFSTTLKTPDNKVVILPNSSITDNAITNFSKQKVRRIDLTIGVSYDANIKQTKEILAGVLNNDKRVLAEPEYLIGLSELADSSVNFVVRPWVNTDDYWNVYFDLMEKIKIELDANEIGIPYPQMDIHLHSNQNEDS
jgi:small conductance mechanosensitive channel